jgi:hypothetical protein
MAKSDPPPPEVFALKAVNEACVTVAAGQA